MWILLHDDLADPKSADPVLRESTLGVGRGRRRRVRRRSTRKSIRNAVGPNVLKHGMIWKAVGEKTMADSA